VSCRFHDLRHTSVALAIAEGAHPKAIQARMGHSSITVTLDRYGHLFPELDEAIATAFDARLRALGVTVAEGVADGPVSDRP
jgi:integrase